MSDHAERILAMAERYGTMVENFGALVQQSMTFLTETRKSATYIPAADGAGGRGSRGPRGNGHSATDEIDKDRLYTPEEAGKLIGVSKSSIHGYMSQGRLPKEPDPDTGHAAVRGSALLEWRLRQRVAGRDNSGPAPSSSDGSAEGGYAPPT